jgi:hypothetical protein
MGSCRAAAGPATTPGAGAWLRLQRAAGNQAVLGLIQRKGGGKGQPRSKPKAPPPEDLALGSAAPPEGLRGAGDGHHARVHGPGRRQGDADLVGGRPAVQLEAGAELLADPAKLRGKPAKKYALVSSLFDPELADALEAPTPEERLAVAAAGSSRPRWRHSWPGSAPEGAAPSGAAGTALATPQGACSRGAESIQVRLKGKPFRRSTPCSGRSTSGAWRWRRGPS